MGGQKNFVLTPTKRRGPIAAEFSSPGPASISLPSTLGTGGFIKPRSPAFTLSGRSKAEKAKLGPGPGTYNVAGVSKTGKDESIGASMHIKPKDPRQFLTPAPCDYRPEKGDHTVLEASPKFSFGIKVDLTKPNGVPAPNKYSMPSLMGPVMEGGKASSPAFSMSGRPRDADDKMKVPGPGTYNNADVEYYKTEKSPAYSMGQRTVLPVDHTIKPGPGAHCPEKCVFDKTPQFTMTARIEEKNKNFVPGPGTYNSGDLDICRNKLPVFTLGQRIQEHDKSFGPGPATYNSGNLDVWREKLPVFTLGQRIQEHDKSFGPGPATYDSGNLDACKDKLPVFTMGQKIEEHDKSFGPGPATYDSGNLDVWREKLPVFTLGQRIQEHDKSFGPGPATYNSGNLDACKDKLPVFTMGQRIEEHDKSFGPGPATYDSGDLDACKAKLPVFTMSPKTTLPTDKTMKPSPCAYSPQKHDLTQTPEFSFGVKHSQYMGQLRDQ